MKIRNKNGALRAKDVVKSARAKASPLHNYFDWNNTTAGEKWRVEQARYLIRNIMVVYDEKKPKKMVRDWENLDGPNKEKNLFFNVTNDIMPSEQGRIMLLQKAFDELSSFVKRYQALSELADIFRAVEKSRKNYLKKLA